MTTRDLTAPLTRKSFTQGDKAVFIRDTTVRLMEAAYGGGNHPHLSVCYNEASALWDQFIVDLPEGERTPVHVRMPEPLPIDLQWAADAVEAAASGQDLVAMGDHD